MPEKFTQFHITLTVFAVLITAVCVAWIIAAIRSFKSGKGKSAKITAIVSAGIFQLFAAAFLVMSVMREFPGGSAIVNGDFIIVSGDYKYTVPVLSGAFAAISKYAFFAVLYGLAEACALAGLILQIVLFSKARTLAKKAQAEKMKADRKTADEKALKEQNEKRFSGEKVCVLGNKRIIKSNAAAVYCEYLEDKKATENKVE